MDSAVTGSVSGLIGAGGNIGGVGFGLIFRGLDYRPAFLWMGCTVVGSALLTLCVRIPGHRMCLGGHDSHEVLERRQRANLPNMIAFESVEMPDVAPTEHEEHSDHS